MPTTHISSSDAPDPSPEPNRWYLAYGSNLSSNTFEGRRGIRPLACCNVVVPSLQLSFDLPGFPYMEPCFANVRPRRHGQLPPHMAPENDAGTGPDGADSPANHHRLPITGSPTTAPPIGSPQDALNTQPLALTGVAYLITAEDYRKVITSEGGGGTYEEIAVDCWRIGIRHDADHIDDHRFPAAAQPSGGVSEVHSQQHTTHHHPDKHTDERLHPFQPDEHPRLHPRPHRQPLTLGAGHAPAALPQLGPIGPSPALGDPFIAYTLCAPDSKRRSAPMHPSKRYMNIIRTGAREHDLPPAYVAYLDTLPHYQPTRLGQKMGAAFFLATWFPFLAAVMVSQRIFADKKTGRVPRWLGTITYTVFAMMWKSYDMVWKKVFGSGEVSNGAWKALGSGVGAVGWQWKAQEQESKR